MAPPASSTVTKTAQGLKNKSDNVSVPKDGVKAEHDFFWTYTEEPHRTRRLAIIKAHPEVSLTISLCDSGFRNIWNHTN